MADEALIGHNRFGLYHIPAAVQSRPAARAVLAGRVYEPDTIEFMRANCGDGDIIHAGTFFGDFLPGLSGNMAKGAKVWAFEPNPGSFAAARQTVALNDLGNVELRNAALSDRAGELLFQTHRKDGSQMGGVSRVVEAPGEGVGAVRSVMLDYAVPTERKVSILQLDVEGHEKSALLGAYHIINIWQPILVLEYFEQARWISRTFRNLKYRVVGKVHGNHVYATGPVDI
ncbi:FkbM family methyltransferase [Sedimentitalea sp. XS_ASV28]|uniref:FkbM family methyltransferase n=1 Tax=Sedimentitalea sp. XS_ASV28 TaxID=3241296 RepID=UPI0035122AE4